ncbi:MAG: hypothetical protein ACI905_001972 [Roseivirga sp.]|jgi:hypothetical protein
MKKLIFLSLLLTLMSMGTAMAQNLTPPKSGNAIRLKDYTISVPQGQSLDAQMWVVKSKKYKIDLGTPKASGNEGVEFVFEEVTGEENIFSIQVKVDAVTPIGDYMYILMVPGTGRNAVTGTTLKIKVVAK